jgi:hypothetical protein
LRRPETPGPFFRRGEATVDEGFFKIESTAAAQILGQRIHHAAHHTGSNPLLETPVARLVRRIPLGKISPGCTGA